MFHESLAREQPQHKATVPFLLQLAVMSPPLLGAVSSELVDSLQPAVLNQLHQCLAPLPREDLDNMVTILVHLIAQTAAGAYRTLQFLVNTAIPASVITPPGGSLAPHEGVRDACDRLVHLLLLHLQKLVYHRGAASLSDAAPPRPVPFLDSLQAHLRELCAETLRLERKRFLWQHRLLGLLGVYSAPFGAADALVLLLRLARGENELALVPQLFAVLSASLTGLLPAALAACVRHVHAGTLPPPEIAQFCRNLALILQWEGGEGGAAAMGAQLAAVLPQFLPDLAQLLLHRDAEVAEAVCHLLSVCPFPRVPPPAHLSAAVRAAVRQFFRVLRQKNAATLCHSARLVARLSAVSPAAGKAAVQQLVEGALRRQNAPVFGGFCDNDAADTADRDATARHVSLLEINQRFTTTVNFTGGVWAVFHAGVIGRGLKSPAPGEETPEEPAHNLQIFLTLLLRCCGARAPNPPINPPPNSHYSPPIINPDAAKAVAAALVEAVCPEAAGGGDLIWPPEDQTRATVERDLRICRRFRQNPLLFPLLRVVAAGRPALCYCSVLLRGLLAALMAHWDACRQPSTTSSPWQLGASCAVVAAMAEGSLLPPVLGNVHEVFPHLAPFEVHLLLLSVWDYLRDNHPLPQKFTFLPEKGVFVRDFARDGEVGKHLGVLHSVLHKNIHKLGRLAGRFRP